MRSILFDELIDPEIKKIREYLHSHATPSGVEDLYWINLDRELYNANQIKTINGQNGGSVDNFRLAVELGSDWVRFELFIRTEGRLDVGGSPADERQTMFALRWANDMAAKLNLASCL